MKWYSSLEYRPEADADIWVRSGESPGPDGITQAVSELVSARLGFYDKLDEYCGLEIIWQYANGYKDREPIKWDEFEAMLPLPTATFEAKLLNTPSEFDSSILHQKTKTYKSSKPLRFKRHHDKGDK